MNPVWLELRAKAASEKTAAAKAAWKAAREEERAAWHAAIDATREEAKTLWKGIWKKLIGRAYEP